MLNSRYLIATILAVLLVGCASADPRPKAVIDTSVHKANFRLTSAEKLFALVFGSLLVKSEFETEARYHARLEQMRPVGSYFILVAPNFVRYVYSAEIQRLVVFANQTESDIMVAYSSQNLGKVPMQNAFGATVDATLIKSRSLELQVQNPPLSFPQGLIWKQNSNIGVYGMQDIGLGLPVSIAPAEEERVVKNKSYGLVIGFTVGDLSRARREKGGSAPTFDAPISIGGYSSKLPVIVHYLAVLDRKTNNVVVSWGQ